MVSIHINCDVGEEDEAMGTRPLTELAPFISAANIACGFHAGNPSLMAYSIRVCLENDIEIGAHPSFNDRAGFGRKLIPISPGALYDDIIYQIGAISALADMYGAKLHHVKPHGALYNETARNEGLCRSVYQAVRDFDADLLVYGLAGSVHESVSGQLGLRFVAEGFADRCYDTESSLVDRKHEEAVLTDPEAVAGQVEMLMSGQVHTLQDGVRPLHTDTICVHGDNPNVLRILQYLSERFVIKKIQ